MEREPLLTGRRTPPVPVRLLRAGPVTCELDGIELRNVRQGSVGLANLVYVAVRDQAWNTPPAVVEGLTVTQHTGSFLVVFRARNVGGGIDLSWQGTIRGEADGTISYSFDGIAANGFRYNRIGFNILHSVSEVAGRPYRTSGGDDDQEQERQGTFPVHIAPQGARGGRLTGMLEPFRRLQIDLVHGSTVTLECSGDEFETEDQRNFADSTFKTYSTPLQRPAPRSARAGERLTQAVRITTTGGASVERRPTTEGGPVQVVVGEPLDVRLPAIGLGVASDGIPLDGPDADRIGVLRPGHLRVVVAAVGAASIGADARSAAAAADARAVGARLEIELLLGHGGEGLERAAQLLAPLGEMADAVLVRAPGDGPIDSGTPAAIVVAVRDRLADVLPGVPVGSMVGTLAALTREPVDGSALVMVGLPFSPTVHRDDDRTVMENLLGLDQQVRTAIDALGGRPIRVGPVTLATVNGPWPGGDPGSDGLPPQVDVRQPSLFTAAWTVGALAGLLVAGARSVTVYETTGWRGVMERSIGSGAPGCFLSSAGGVYPVWHVLADLATHRDGLPRAVAVSDPGRVATLAVTSPQGSLVLIANLTRDTVEVNLQFPAALAGLWRIRWLDEHTGDTASRQPDAFRSSGDVLAIGSSLPLSLSAYAVATIGLLPD